MIKVWPSNTNNKSHHKCTKITCVFEQTSFISIPPSTSKNPNVQTQTKSLVHDYCKKIHLS